MTGLPKMTQENIQVQLPLRRRPSAWSHVTNLLFWQHQDLSRALMTHQTQVQTPVLIQVQLILVTLTARNSGFDLKEFIKIDVIVTQNFGVIFIKWLPLKSIIAPQVISQKRQQRCHQNLVIQKWAMLSICINESLMLTHITWVI